MVKLSSIANNFNKNRWLIFAVLLLFAIATLITIMLFMKYSNRQTVNRGIPWQNNIYPGFTTKQELEKTLGNPLKTESSGDNAVYFYKTSNEYRQNEIEIESDVVKQINEQVLSNDKRTLNDFWDTLGPEETKLYGAVSSFTPGYFWGKNGVMVFAGQFDHAIIEIWYFKPTTLEEFLKSHPEIRAEENGAKD